ncbi:transcriptional regulator LldR [Enterobacteriaceae bacterium 4M9]|nr:transcriptional regulator LldR [Enterobacteriaceae bacterium 4M9]
MTVTDRRVVEQLAERLRALIDEQKMTPGQRLPAERQLALELGVSRNSVREALARLRSEGRLVSRRGGGSYISLPNDDWSDSRIVQPIKVLMAGDPDYRYDILEARHAIEGSTAWHAALRASAADKEKLQYCFDATLKFHERDDPDLAAQADVRFHLAIAEASHNLVLLQTMRGFFDLLQSSVMQSRQRMYTQPPIFARLTEQHQGLLEAILDGDAERARRAAQEHLGFVHSTIRTLDEDEARQARATRLPDDDIDEKGTPL